MKKLLLLLLFCGGAYWLYQRYLTPGAVSSGSGDGSAQPASNSQIAAAPGVFTMPDPVAWKEIATSSDSREPIIGVALVDGNRWRVEMRKPSRPLVVVCVFDGTKFLSSSTTLSNPIMIDAASSMRTLFAEINKLRPIATGERDGHRCWEFQDTDAQGTKGEAWVDRETFFPVLVTERSTTGVSSEIHFQLLKSDFTILRKTAFDTRFMAPMLTPFLNP